MAVHARDKSINNGNSYPNNRLHISKCTIRKGASLSRLRQLAPFPLGDYYDYALISVSIVAPKQQPNLYAILQITYVHATRYKESSFN